MNRRGLTGPTCFAGENGEACSNILYENSTILDDRHSSPIRREPRYLAKPCKNTGFSAKFDMLGKLAASETGVTWSKRSGVFGLVIFPEFFENLKTQLFGRASKSALLQGYPAKHVSLH